MKIVFLQGQQVLYQKELRDDTASQVKQYIESVTGDARASQPPQTQQQLPPDPREEARMRANARPSNPRGWWVPPDQGDSIFNQNDEGSEAGVMEE